MLALYRPEIDAARREPGRGIAGRELAALLSSC
jgi:hypothetical protein